MDPRDELLVGLVSISDRASQGVYVDQGVPGLTQWFQAALATPWRFETRLIARGARVSVVTGKLGARKSLSAVEVIADHVLNGGPSARRRFGPRGATRIRARRRTRSATRVGVVARQQTACAV